MRARQLSDAVLAVPSARNREAPTAAQQADVGASTVKKRHPVRITLSIRCECGHGEEVPDYGDAMRVTPGYTNENGTSWPGEIELYCRVCGGVDGSRTC